MEDLSLYNEDEIYEMLENGTITIDDLDVYIKDGTISAETLEIYLKDGLIDIKDLDEYIKIGTINTSDIASYINTNAIEVEDVAEYIKTGVIDGEKLSEEVRDHNDVQAIETIEEERVNNTEPIMEETPVAEEKPTFENPDIKQSEPQVTPVFEEPETTPTEFEETPQNIEQPELVPTDTNDEDYKYFESDENSYEEARNSMEATYKYCMIAGMNIKDLSLNGKSGRGPYISFEINNESKQFLDHLMLELYGNEGLALEFMRSMSTKDELFTIEIANDNMSREEFYTHVRDTFLKIYETVQTTRNDLDYVRTMPEGLKDLKTRFRNDDPDIGQDFTIGYVRNDGKDSYYIVADDYEKALSYAQAIGYDIKNSQGANIFEVEIKGNITDTKLENASVDLAHDKEALNIIENGVSDLDIYGSLPRDPRVEMIENFIETSNDPHLMSKLEISIPPENPSQRIVYLKDEAGVDEVLVFPNGKEFDNKVMPRIIDTYADNNPVSKENINIEGSDSFDRVSCQVESENNTTLKIDGYTENEVDKMIKNVEEKTNENNNQNEMTNSRQKTLGTYPTNQAEENKAFVSMPVLLVICVLFILMIILLIFAN